MKVIVIVGCGEGVEDDEFAGQAQSVQAGIKCAGGLYYNIVLNTTIYHLNLNLTYFFTGRFMVTLYIFSDVYLGLDQQYDIMLDLVPSQTIDEVSHLDYNV